MSINDNNITNNSTLVESNGIDECVFRYGFVDKPWDDRSKKSKIGIVALLLAIFLITAICIVNNFAMHYRGYSKVKTNIERSGEINCQLINMADFSFAARIHSAVTEEMLCVGALIRKNTVLANGACAWSGPIRLYLGNNKDPLCKKGFSVDTIQPIFHDGVLSKKLVLLTNFKTMAGCANVIHIGKEINIESQGYIIGRPVRSTKMLSRQPVAILGKDCNCAGMPKASNSSNQQVICVKAMARCPVLAGDLLVQDGRLLGLASTSIYQRDQNSVICFADLSPDISVQETKFN